MDGRRVFCAAVVAVTMVGIAACGDGDASRSNGPESAGATSPSPSPSSVASATPSAPAVYRAVDKPCDVVDASAVESLTGPLRHKEQNATNGGVSSLLVCSLRYEAHSLIVHMNLFENVPGEAMYEGLRKVQEGESKVTEVPGVGTAAYAYDDPLTGPHVVAHDGNLYFSVGLHSDSDATGGDVSEQLSQVARHTLAKMRG